MAKKEYWDKMLNKLDNMSDAEFEQLVTAVNEAIPDIPFCILDDEVDACMYTYAEDRDYGEFYDADSNLMVDDYADSYVGNLENNQVAA